MKQIFPFLILALVTLFSCRQDEETLQNIDQVLNIYVKDASGKDLLNSKIKTNYSNVALLDLLAKTDQQPVNTVILADKDSVRFVEYVAGATRLIKDSINKDSKSYYSSMIMRFTKIENDKPVVDDDTIRIEYQWTPQKFEVSKMYHSNRLVFIKSASQPNIVSIVK